MHQRNATFAGAVLVLPLVVLLVALLVAPHTAAPIVISLMVAPALSLIGGIILGMRTGTTHLKRIGLAIAWTFLLLAGSEALLFFGCASGVVELRFGG